AVLPVAVGRGVLGPRNSWLRALIAGRNSSGPALRSGSFPQVRRDERGQAIVDVQLDAVLRELGSGVVLSRPMLLHLLQVAVGEDPEIESRPGAAVPAQGQGGRPASEGPPPPLGPRRAV